MLMKGIWPCTSTGTRRAQTGTPALCPSLLLSGRGGPLTALVPRSAHSSEPHGGTPMQEQVLEVGEELVIEGGIRLTLLAVEAGAVLLGVTAPEPSDGAGPQAGDRPSSGTQGALGTAHKPAVGGVGTGRCFACAWEALLRRQGRRGRQGGGGHSLFPRVPP